jgi:hypothetical protein
MKILPVQAMIAIELLSLFSLMRRDASRLYTDCRCSGKSCLYRQRYGYRHSAGCVSLARGYEDIACSGNDRD